MRLTNIDTPSLPEGIFDQVNANAPWAFSGSSARFGDADPWAAAPVGSLYYNTATNRWWNKIADANVDNDWTEVIFAAGDQSLSGVKTFSQLKTSAAVTTTFGVGDAVTDWSTASEAGYLVHHTSITLLVDDAAHDIDLADADDGDGAKIYDFPAGYILILGATINGTVTLSNAYEANPNDFCYVAIGTAQAGADNDLTGTEQDIIAKQTLDTVGSTVLSFDFKGAMTAPASFDGTTSAVDLYFNAAVLGANVNGASTVRLTGTLQVFWINLGDY